MSRCLRCGAGNEWIEPVTKESAKLAASERANAELEAENDRLALELEEARAALMQSYEHKGQCSPALGDWFEPVGSSLLSTDRDPTTYNAVRAAFAAARGDGGEG